MRMLLPLCLFAMALQAEHPAPLFDPDALLLQVRKKMLVALDRLPRYMCTETIDRLVSRPASANQNPSCEDVEKQRAKKGFHVRPHTSDRLRLDVAVSDQSEMYSWAGENRFEDRTLAELVHSGATSTGAFSSFLSAVFQSEAATFRYDGERTVEGRLVAEFGFHVALEKSRYSVGDKLHHAIVAYHGTFLIDPVSAALIRLTVTAEQIPTAISACSISNTLDYGSVRLNGSDFVLPAHVSFQVVRSDGSELENRTVFSGCHQFLGESSLRFDDPDKTKPLMVAANDAKDLSVPPNRMFTIVLTQPIATATAAAGDPVTATLRKAIKGRDHRVILPAGALVKGRIVQMQHVYSSDYDTLVVALQLETVESAGTEQPFRARLESVIQGRDRMIHLSDPRVGDNALEEIVDMAEPTAGVLRFYDVNPDFVIRRGTQLTGTTLASH